MSINWGKLYEQGRCKFLGVSWSPEEAHAVHILKIPADFVRQGCLTIEDYERAVGTAKEQEEKTGKIPLLHLKKNQLYVLCEKHGVAVTPETPRSSMLEALLNLGLPKSIPVSEVQKAQES